MNNPTLYLVGGILLILFFCVATYFFTKTFRAFHVVMLFLVFGMSIWFVAMAALEHKTRLHWRKTVDRLETELEEVERKKEVLVANYTEDSEGNRPDTVLTMRNKLNRILLDRGRVWRDCLVTGLDQASFQAQVSTVAPGADAATAPPNRIDQNAILYLFAEEPQPAGYKVPRAYLGEFKVTAATDTSVTIAPTDLRMLLNSQRNVMRNSAAANVTWALYEIMPIDGHRVYAADPNADISLTIVEDQPIFGSMDEDLIRALYNPETILNDYRINFPGLTPEDEQKIRPQLAQMLDSLLRNGGPVKTGADGGAIDPPENVYEKVQFDKNLTVIVDGNTGQGALSANYFDSQGRATVDRLRRSNLTFLNEEDAADGTRNVEFSSGDVAVFHFEKAQELVASETVRPIEPRFVRTLIDFNYELHMLFNRYLKAAQNRLKLQAEMAAMNKAEEDAKKYRDARRMERDGLLVDKQKIIQEQQQVTSYVGQLRLREAALKKELSALYRSNAAMAARLAARSKEIADEINSRTEAAGAESGE